MRLKIRDNASKAQGHAATEAGMCSKNASKQ